MPSHDPAVEVRATLQDFDRCFAAGDAGALADHFAENAQLLLQHHPAIQGRPAIRSHWTQLFDAYDTAAWRTEIQLLDAHADSATVISVYSETLVHRGDAPSQVVHGRLAFFLRREVDSWRVGLVMNSHDRPVELVPGGTTSPAGAPDEGAKP